MRYSISSQLLVFLLIILFLFIIQDGWKSEPKLDESTHKLYEFKMNGVFFKNNFTLYIYILQNSVLILVIITSGLKTRLNNSSCLKKHNTGREEKM